MVEASPAAGRKADAPYGSKCRFAKARLLRPAESLSSGGNFEESLPAMQDVRTRSRPGDANSAYSKRGSNASRFSGEVSRGLPVRLRATRVADSLRQWVALAWLALDG